MKGRRRRAPEGQAKLYHNSAWALPQLCFNSMLRRLPAPNLVQNFLPTATAGPGLASLLADGVSPGVQFFLAVCHNADALPEGQVTSDADAFREIEYLNTPCSLFGSGPIFAKCRGDNGEETDRESR